MQRPERRGAQLRAAVVLVAALAVASCSSDDDAGDDTTATADDAAANGDADTGLEVEGSVGDELLLVPRAYLQGEWCDSDGGSWSIDGDIAVLTDGTGGQGEFPLDVLFIAAPGTQLFEQADDQFTIGSEVEQVTFTRGSC